MAGIDRRSVQGRWLELPILGSFHGRLLQLLVARGFDNRDLVGLALRVDHEVERYPTIPALRSLLRRIVRRFDSLAFRSFEDVDLDRFGSLRSSGSCQGQYRCQDRAC